MFVLRKVKAIRGLTPPTCPGVVFSQVSDLTWSGVKRRERKVRGRRRVGIGESQAEKWEGKGKGSNLQDGLPPLPTYWSLSEKRLCLCPPPTCRQGSLSGAWGPLVGGMEPHWQGINL